MGTLTVVGCQFGDEGKGKIIDFLSERFDVNVRFNGGENAGHTVVTDGQTIKYHLVPAGFLRSKVLVIANGVVINVKKLSDELDYLKNFRNEFDLRISEIAHVVTPLHFERDKYLEKLRGSRSIGTTLKGIGPAYESKFGRYGIRLLDLEDEAKLRDKLELLKTVYSLRTEEGYIESLLESYNRIKKYVTDTRHGLKELLDNGSDGLFETAQGTFIDVEFGTYPFVTSSHTITGGVTEGTGLSPKYFTKFLGVAKAYTTRVGEGIFPSEILGARGETLRKLGNEFGSTTGRPRRVGYLDIPMLRTAVDLNSLDYLALTKEDVLGRMDEIKVVVSYERNGTEIKSFNPNVEVDKVNYEEFKPWEDNPQYLEKYLEFIEDELRVPIMLVGSGEKRNEIIKRGEIAF